MSAGRVKRVLARLAAPSAVLALERGGPSYGVFLGTDRRRRPVLRLNANEVRALEAEGAISRDDEGVFRLSSAGGARVVRDAEEAGEGFVAQHAPIVRRSVMDADGDVVSVRGLDPDVLMRKLAGLRGATGGQWLSDTELRAAQRLRNDWAVSQAGLVRGSDWNAPPLGGTRGSGNAQEAALARRCDARRRVADALDALAAPLKRIVERVCLHEDGLEALERSEGWPARSGKLALKLGLAQLAAAL